MTVRTHESPLWVTRASWLVVFLLCTAPVLAAFLPLLRSPGETVSTVIELAESGRLWRLWLKTCTLAALGAVVATVIGAPLGLRLGTTYSGNRRWLPALLALPMFLPTHVVAVAWIDLVGQQGLLASMGLSSLSIYNPGGVILIHALCWYPVPMFAVWYRFRHLDPAILEAARGLATPTTVFRLVTLPLVVNAAVTGALIVFTLSLLSFSVPSLLQTQVFTVEIFAAFNSLLDQRQAALLALPLVATGGGSIAVLLAIGRRPAMAGAYAGPAIPVCGYSGSRPWGMYLFSLLTLGLPAVALFYRIGSMRGLLTSWNTGLSEIGTSLLLSSLGASVLILLVLPVARSVPGRPSWPMWPAVVAYFVSGPVFGTGLIQLWNHPGIPGAIYDHGAILIIAMVGRYALFAGLGARLLSNWLPLNLRDAASTLGAGRWRTLMQIELPALWHPLQALWAFLFLLIMGELECIILVAPPGWVPVSLRIFTLMHYGPTETVSALALLQALTSLAFLLLFFATSYQTIVYTPDESRYHRVMSRGNRGNN